ncbi:MAG TPA: FG-GAP-like repeat-containing protein, partial [Chloroflexia bacterium]|nr:FG-GAP-like repeat-containing protein [Chloroflexia bacterium]
SNSPALAAPDTRIGASAAQGSDGGNCQPWTLVNVPNPRTHHYLNDIDAIAPDDIWAVGEYYDENNYTPDTALTMHWDGTQWTIVPTPEAPASARLALYGVSALSPNDVWAVGENFPSSASNQPSAYQPLAMHWDGVQWTIVPTPQEPGGLLLNDVVALAPDNVWAVGANDGAHATRAMHWDGTAWSIVPTPNGGGFSDDNVLTSIAAVSPNDIWAVGYIYPKGGTPTTLSIHWNGTQWTRVITPNPGNYFRRLNGVTALAANDVWAVGSYSTNSGKTYTPLFLHWNGTQWQHVSSPQVGDYDSLDDVHAIAPNDIWAVGTTAACDFCPFQTLTMHWNGTAWTPEFSPNGFRDFSRLEAVTATSPGDVWAVGFTDEYEFPYTSDSLIMRRFCPVPTPTGTPPTSTPTRTRVSTYTPTPTLTVAATPTCSPGGLRVLIVYADYESAPATLRNGILAHPGVQTVDMVRSDSSTPSFAQLMQYDVVVPFAGSSSWADLTTLGNRLADYQDAHGIVVAFNYSWSGPPRGIGGRWQGANYSPFENYGGNVYSDGTLGNHNAAHPLMAGVTNLTAFNRANLALKAGAEQVAAWHDGPPLIATKGRAVGVSAYVGDDNDGWSGDFARIVVNAGRWLRPGQCGSVTPGSTSTPGPPTATRTATAVLSPTATVTPGGPGACTVPSFDPRTNHAVGDAPERVAVGDFNHDGNPDIAVVNKDSSSLSVLLGGGGGFGQATTYELPAQPSGITVGDYNRDGNLDVAASGWGVNMAMILLGNGSGGFGTATSYGSGSGGAGIATADFNNDGSLDLVVADDGHDTMLVLINNGSGGFGVGVQYDLDWIPTDIAVGDFNNDGNPDVAAPNSFSDNVSVRLGDGSGSFGPLTNYNVAANPISIAVADFNNDGNDDFATSSPDTGNITVRLGNGSGGFGTPSHFPAGNGSMSIGVADFNLDGNPDIAVANVPNNVAVLLGNGSGGFGPINNFAAGSGPKAVAVGDFNRDNKPDLAVTNNSGDSVSVLMNSCGGSAATATGTPVAPSTTAIPGTPNSTSVATVTQPPISTGTVSAIASATSPAGSTPTVCAVAFTDVPLNHTFYASIKCLACNGILSGYSDGTFRPNNDITRGQIAKVVSNAAGFNDSPGTQIYEDVPASNTFYAWINRLSRRGHMGGYNCGTVPSEPCGSANSPYFRPNANATRGQLAKIVASAASITGTPTGQRYADVEPDSTFYVWIEQLSNLGVMGGYPCGTVSGEPCDNQNRPYFRPSNNVTRGQASKIVANTFIPGCVTPVVR